MLEIFDFNTNIKESSPENTLKILNKALKSKGEITLSLGNITVGIEDIIIINKFKIKWKDESVYNHLVKPQINLLTESILSGINTEVYGYFEDACGVENAKKIAQDYLKILERKKVSQYLENIIEESPVPLQPNCVIKRLSNYIVGFNLDDTEAIAITGVIKINRKSMYGYCIVGDFHEGFAKLYNNDNFSWNYIDNSGRVISNCTFTHAEDFVNGFAKVKKGSKFGRLTKNGEFIIDSESIGEYLKSEEKDELEKSKKQEVPEQHLKLVLINGEPGYMDPKGNSIIVASTGYYTIKFISAEDNLNPIIVDNSR